MERIAVNTHQHEPLRKEPPLSSKKEQQARGMPSMKPPPLPRGCKRDSERRQPHRPLSNREKALGMDSGNGPAHNAKVNRLCTYCGTALEATSGRQRYCGRKCYMAASRDRSAKYQAAYRAKNREKIAKRNAAYQAKHRKSLTKYQAAYYVANKESIAKRKAAYRAARRARKATRRRRARGAGQSLPGSAPLAPGRVVTTRPHGWTASRRKSGYKRARGHRGSG